MTVWIRIGFKWVTRNVYHLECLHAYEYSTTFHCEFLIVLVLEYQFFYSAKKGKIDFFTEKNVIWIKTHKFDHNETESF